MADKRLLRAFNEASLSFWAHAKGCALCRRGAECADAHTLRGKKASAYRKLKKALGAQLAPSAPNVV